jgi:hypothetical protein
MLNVALLSDLPELSILSRDTYDDLAGSRGMAVGSSGMNGEEVRENTGVSGSEWGLNLPGRQLSVGTR